MKSFNWKINDAVWLFGKVRFVQTLSQITIMQSQSPEKKYLYYMKGLFGTSVDIFMQIGANDVECLFCEISYILRMNKE